ncbi:MAG: hypothetical protein OEW67_14415 [Cyclobacteriaceae bacterium]|nr:hypothetical protein [Cyclobacteriaceae bacterium]
MKKNLLVICLLIVANTISIAQEILNKNEYLIHENNGGKVNFVDAVYEPDLSIIKLQTVTYYKKESDSKYYPQLNTLKFNSNDLSFINEDETVRSGVESKLKELHSVNPNYVRKEKSTTKSYRIESGWGNYTIYSLENGEIKVHKSEKPEVSGKLIVHNKTIVNEKGKSFIVLYGDKKKDKALKGSEYKELSLVQHTTEGSIKKSTPISLTYPREVIFSSKIARPNINFSDQKDYDKAIFVFGRPKNVGKKDGNPDITSYEILCINKSGDVLFQHKFNTDNIKTLLKPSYAYEANGKIVLFAKMQGSNPSFTQFSFNESGFIGAEPISSVTLNENVQPKLMLTYGKYFDIDFHTISPDGTITLGGHGVEESSETIPGNPEKGIPNRTVTKREPYIFSLISFNNQLKFNKHLSFATTNNTRPSIVVKEDQRFLILNKGSNPKIDFNVGQATFMDKKTANGEIVENFSFKAASNNDSAPVIVSLNTELNSFDFGKQNLYNINNQSRYFIDSQGSLIFIGFKGNNGAIVQSTDKFQVRAFLIKIKLQ